MTHITAFSGFLPVANAFGWESSTIYNLGVYCNPEETTKASRIFISFWFYSLVAGLALFKLSTILSL